MVITTSAARTISSVHGLGNSSVMSMPTSAIAATAAVLISVPGSDPPDHTTAWSPARWRSQPAAIWERPALCTHMNSTLGTAEETEPSRRARAPRRCLANFSASSGR